MPLHREVKTLKAAPPPPPALTKSKSSGAVLSGTGESVGAVFRRFDKDGGGTISLDEVKEVLCSGQDIEDSAWERINQELQLIDADGSGELDFEEFCMMLEKMV